MKSQLIIAKPTEKSTVHKIRLKQLVMIFSLEGFFAGVYISITRSLFFVMLAEYGFKLFNEALITLAASMPMLLLAVLFYRNPLVLSSRPKLWLVLSHISERILWTSLPVILFSLGLIPLLIAYTLANIFTVIVSALMTMAVFSCGGDAVVRRITGIRNSAMLIASLLGSILAFITLYTMPHEVTLKYVYAYSIAGSFALLSWIMALLIPVPRHIKVQHLDRKLEEEDKIKSTLTYIYISFFQSALSLFNMSWLPYLVSERGIASYYAPALSAIATLAAALASPMLSGLAYKRLIMVAMLFPLASLTAIPAPLTVQVAVAITSSLAATAASFIAAFLYAELSRHDHPLRPPLRIVMGNATGLLMASLVGLLINGGYSLGLAASAILSIISLIVVMLGVREVSLLPDPLVRVYGKIIYETSITSYKVTIEFSIKYVLTALRVLALLTALLMIYLTYRATLVLIITG